MRAYGATIRHLREFLLHNRPRSCAQTLNTWFRTNTVYDALIDFDAVVAIQFTLTNLLPAYDTGIICI